MLDRITGYKRLLALAALNGGGASIIERTAIGNPLTFLTDLARPLKSLLIPFTPQQEGTGDPSPQNVRPIVPWNGLKVWKSGQNIITNGFTNGVLDLNTGAKSTNPNYITSEYIPVVPLKSYYFKCPTVVSSELDICYYDKDKHYIGYADADGYVSCNAPGRSRKTPAGCYYVRIDTRNAQYNNDICINYPASVTGYVPAVGVTETDIVFPSPVYGGTLDVVSGVLTVTHGIMELDGTQNYFGFASRTDTSRVMFNSFGLKPNDTIRTTIFSENSKVYSPDYVYSNDVPGISENQNKNLPGIWVSVENSLLSETTIAGLRAYLAENPIIVCYPLATPQEITLTPEQITAIVGDNTIWSDADGSMTAVYLVSAAYADSHPVGVLGSGLLGGGFGSGTGEPDEPGEPEEPGEPDDDTGDDTGDDQPADDQQEES